MVSLNVPLVMVPAVSGLRLGRGRAETPLPLHPTPVAGTNPTVFCQKIELFWQNEGFWWF